ncbi:MAG: isoprenylcysteine carboxylmethyltransferase family protein [Betaproteobacteria bacterium]|nr:isoprenylcysteine carboxylmethyltransferase family protein [Betaproteobacteria bacterium]
MLRRFVQGNSLTLPLRWQRWLDVYIFLNVFGFFAWQSWKVVTESRLDFIEGLFIVHNVILCLCFALRRPARAIGASLSHQAVAVCAFYSGMLFVGAEPTADPLLSAFSWWTLLIGMLIGIFSLLQLGKSFGVLIAVRELRTTGLYGWIRHPMYLSDIVMRLGYFLSHPTLFVGILFVASSACYVVRAILEERFWMEQEPAYVDYMQRVRHRFIPGIF